MIVTVQESSGSEVRSFVFVAGLDEVTNIFENYEINQAIEKILKEADIEYNAVTADPITAPRKSRY